MRSRIIIFCNWERNIKLKVSDLLKNFKSSTSSPNLKKIPLPVPSSYCLPIFHHSPVISSTSFRLPMVSHPMRRFISNFKSYNNNTVPSNSQAPFASSCLREAMSEDIPTQAANIENSLARFSDLPPEIRVKTWQAALAAEKEPNFIEARDLAPNVSIDGRPLYLRSRRGVSARLAHTNREARHEVLRDDESFVMRYMKQILVRTPISLYSDQSQRRRRHDTIGQRVMFDSHDDFLALD